MINEGMMFLASYGYYGGTIGNTLNRLEQMGVFAYVLPFLLIFTLVFGILSSTNLFKNKGVNAVIALVVGLMALQMDMVPVFFAQVFPRMGIALAAILVMLILAGFFFEDTKTKLWAMRIMLGVGIIAAIVVLTSASGNTGFYASYWFYANGPYLVLGVAVLVMMGIIIALAGGDGKKNKKGK
jgi:hypothetical protein